MKSDPKKLTDEQLVADIIRTKDSRLFGIIYDRYSNKVYRKALSFIRDQDVAQDMVHDIFLKVFMQLGKFEGRSRFSTWLYAVTYNYCVEFYRKKNRYSTLDINEGPDISDGTDVTEEEFLGLRKEHLKRALGKIAPEDRMILLMKYQDELPIKEIMNQLSISESAVKMRLKRARQRIKKIIVEMEKRSA